MNGPQCESENEWNAKEFPPMRKHFPQEFCAECNVVLGEQENVELGPVQAAQSAAHSTRQTSSLPWIIQRAVIDTNWNSLFTFDAHQLAGEVTEMTRLPSSTSPNNWHFSNCTFAHMAGMRGVGENGKIMGRGGAFGAADARGTRTPCTHAAGVN